MNIKEKVSDITEKTLGDIISLRRYFHRNPELSFCEFGTAEKIEQFLDSRDIRHVRIANTGVLAIIDGINPNPTSPVILRADTDALKIKEDTGLEFASINEGVMHACGHDIHTACLAGVLTVLNELKSDLEGTVWGLFQPGEEYLPGGASLVLKEDLFRNITPKVVIGQHVAPDIKSGKFGFRKGTYMASSDEIYLTVKGTGGHGGLPHTLTDPVVAAAQIIVSLQQIVSRNADASVPTVLSFGKFIADGATNVIPSKVEIAGTLRTMDEEWRTKVKERIRQICYGTAGAFGVEVEVGIGDGYPCVVNDPYSTEIVIGEATDLVGIDNIQELGLRMTAEDFGFYAQRYPAVFYRLGVGFNDGQKSGGLHTSTFVANEDAIKYGINLMTLAAIKFLNLKI
ncbi:MAG: M20 family metallopeptidase [Rikenellaceae bacterium]|nr:M20 family metallopeptidase [Rikenellaceae bacterium]